MAITFRASSTTTGTTATTIVMTKPAGTALGDIVLAFITGQSNSLGHPLIGSPAGWTQLQVQNTANVNYVAAVFSLIAGASEPASYTFTFDRGMSASTGGIASYQGGGNIVDGSSANGNASSTSVTASGITTTLANDLLVYLGTVPAAGGGVTITWTTPSGFTQRYAISRTTSVNGIETSDEAFPTPGPTGNISATLSSAHTNIGFLVALGTASTVVLQDFPLFFGAQ